MRQQVTTATKHNRQGNRQRVLPRVLALVAIVLSLVYGAVSPALADDAARVELGLKPVGVDGSYFDMTMDPGEARQLTVEFANFGTRDAVATVYPADVYSLVNGGMGVRLAGEPTSGTTDWVSLDAESLPLAAGETQLRTFAVNVPADTAPGEYLTSVVIQDDTPPATAGNDGVVANRVNRQSIAVAITVPGPLAPALTLGAVGHHVAGGRSVLTVEVHNSGNVRLQPRGELTLSGENGEPVRFELAMDSVYAGTSTVAEFAFTSQLAPGGYNVVLSMSDAKHGVSASTGTISLTVPDTGQAATTSAAPTIATVAAPASVASGTNRSLPMAVILAIVAAFVALGGVVVGKRLLPRRVAAPAATTSQPTTPAPVAIARPVTIRQLAVPTRRGESPAPAQPRVPRFKKLEISTADHFPEGA
jgi:hypothetical protein